MKVTRELIEKYHAGKCTPEEMLMVEEWLLDDEAEEEFIAPKATDRKTLRDAIWEDLQAEIKSFEPEKTSISKSSFSVRSIPFWKLAVAAAAVFILGTFLYNSKQQASVDEVFVLKNSSDTTNKNVSESLYTISLAPKSNIEIDNSTGNIDFCGAVLINPKRDIEFTIQGTCAAPDEQKEKLFLKKGQNYIALNYNSPENENEMIILEEGSLTSLPPVVKRQLMEQFNI
ncbi:hypothetical protein DSL64_21905 [Dyadobacter luteus]|uniref:Uncharacterized protein n=1 Tax=Dyadobacter luteus TaxID=2259619 RepID=A0A3D8Y5W8_9BACT|nr:hypothetical protein [Dyadobacter luteus]REA58042.1 hypothetical protein DSL64_21905 [Dyadobacter luteus]